MVLLESAPASKHISQQELGHMTPLSQMVNQRPTSPAWKFVTSQGWQARPLEGELKQ
jgi:hypothetical protein